MKSHQTRKHRHETDMSENEAYVDSPSTFCILQHLFLKKIIIRRADGKQ